MMSVAASHSVILVSSCGEMKTIVSKTLQIGGFYTLHVESAACALSALHEGLCVNAILIDIGASNAAEGFGFAFKVRARWRALPILLIASRSLLFLPSLPSRAQFIHRPFSQAELLSCVRNLIAQKGSETAALLNDCNDLSDKAPRGAKRARDSGSVAKFFLILKRLVKSA